MAVAHASVSESHTGATGSASQASFSWPHGTGTPRGVVVFVSTYASTASLVTSVTYGGVALTRLTGGVAIDNAGETGRVDTFFLGSGLPTGSQTIVVNRTNNATVMYAVAATVNAAADTAVPEQTIVLLQGDQALTVQSVDDTSPGVDSVRYAATYSGLNTPPGAGTGSTLINSIDIGNYGSAFVRESTAGQGARNVGFSAASDDVAAVHLAIRELVPRSLPQTVGTFTLTGNDATLTKASPKVMAGGTGAFTLTGQPADLRHNPDIEAGVGAFTLSGQPADTRHNPRIDGGTGAFSLTGQPATLTKAVAKVLSAGVGKFLLPERNKRIWSEELDRGNWTKTNASVSANATIAPDGTLTADALIENTTQGVGHFIGQSVTYGTGKTYTHSCYLKLYPGPITRYASVQLGNAGVFGTNTSISVNLSNGAVIGTTGTGITTAVTDEGNGWYRVSISKQYTGSGITSNSNINIITTANASTYNDADGLSGIYVWGIQWEESSGATDYDPTGPSSATNTVLRKGYPIGGSTGAFTLAGQPADIRHNPRIDGGTGAFDLTGQPATLVKAAAPKIITAEVGAFSLASNGAVLRQNYVITAGTGAFAFVGNPAVLKDTDLITAETGIFALTGNPASVRRGYVLIAAAGTFAVAGQPATLRHNPRIEANTGSFALSGGAPVLVRGRYLNGGSGTFTETGQPATFRRTWAIQGGTGNFALTGNPAGLTELGAYEINPIVGAFALTGQAANLAHGQKLQITVGVFNLTGQPATLKQNQQITAGVGAFNLTGQPATLKQNYLINATVGSFSLLGNPATLTKQSALQINAQIGVFNFVGNQAGLAQGRSIGVQAGIFNATGNSANLQFNRKTYPVVGIFTVIGNDATLTFGAVNTTLEPATGSFVIVGNPATLQINTPFSAQNGAFLLSGKPVNFSYEQRRRVVFIF